MGSNGKRALLPCGKRALLLLPCGKRALLLLACGKRALLLLVGTHSGLREPRRRRCLAQRSIRRCRL